MIITPDFRKTFKDISSIHELYRNELRMSNNVDSSLKSLYILTSNFIGITIRGIKECLQGNDQNIFSNTIGNSYDQICNSKDGIDQLLNFHTNVLDTLSDDSQELILLFCKYANNMKMKKLPNDIKNNLLNKNKINLNQDKDFILLNIFLHKLMSYSLFELKLNKDLYKETLNKISELNNKYNMNFNINSCYCSQFSSILSCIEPNQNFTIEEKIKDMIYLTKIFEDFMINNIGIKKNIPKKVKEITKK